MGLEQRLARFERRAHHLVEEDEITTQFDLATSNATDIQEIVDEAYEMLHLPLHHLTGPLERGIRGGDQAQNLDAVTDGRKRVTQLVSQRREKVIFASIGVSQRGRRVGQPLLIFPKRELHPL